MKKSIAVLPGDGIGPEVIEQAVNVLNKIAEKFHHVFTLKYGLIGATAIDKTGSPLPDETLKLCQSADAILFGAIGDSRYDLDPKAKIRPEQGLLKLRQSLKLFTNLRPVKIYKDLINISPLKKERLVNVDLIIVRELTGGIYFGKPRLRYNKGNTAVDTSIYSKDEITRVAKVAFEMALTRRGKVTSVDKANVLETSRLWRETVTEISRKYPSIELNHLFVDNAAMQIIKNPSQFDVILTENMFGDILTDEASVLVGSLGMLPSASIGSGVALYEPIHGSYPKAAGKNIANPIAAILSVEMMLKYSFHLSKEWVSICNAVTDTLNEGWRTRDIATILTEKKNILGTKEMGEVILSNCK
ncbi:3-isopropylmalate dehydrogenase [Candidatus Gottesmanbacteria bacterium RIFCSPHIGHO2_02_FULL_40_13]|uniref:3-isopropylmalate dehydrogenase n=1 Tax=Candidatus Gottesmanbacteria bacterium RIFCSPHIGHO2_02_FULL_40_13 TaxID=1798384 RepID=A0A1F6ACQ5_9BACT|nr:MAG: 3-isopropylmalate dehydrogenase [Candidatus Gottesmanbacteria bacterium RIFCSPHIGHO2_02_FULL_40_13]